MKTDDYPPQTITDSVVVADTAQLFDVITEAVLVARSADERVLAANRSAVEWLGYTRDELLQMTLPDLLLADDSSEKGHQDATEYLCHAKNGITIPVEIRDRPIVYQGQPARVLSLREIRTRKQIEAAARTQRELAEALRDAAAALNSTLQLSEVVQRLLPHISRVIPCESANLMLLENGQARIVAHWGYDKIGVATAHWDTYVWNIQAIAELRWIYEQRRPLVIADTRASPDWTSEEATWVCSFAGAPILINGEVVGIINIDHHQPHRYTEQHAEHLLAFANQAAIAIQNARLHEDTQQLAKQLEERVQQRTQELSEANHNLEEQIARRRQIEAELERERHLLRALIDAVPDEIYFKSATGQILLANKSLMRRVAHRAPGGNVIGSTDLDYGPEERARYFWAKEQALLHGEMAVVDDEVLITDEQQQTKWLSTTKVLLRDQQGETIGIVGINRDVTAIKEAEQRLNHIIAGAYCLLWYAIVEDSGESLRWNVFISSEAAAQRFLPLPEEPGSTYATAWEKSIVAEDQVLRQEIAGQAIRNHQSGYSVEFRCCRLDQEIRWLREEAQIRSLTGGRYSVVGVCTDITEQKKAAETLQRANELLEQRVAQRTAALSRSNLVLQEQIIERERAERAEREQRLLAEALIATAAALNQTLELNAVLDRILTYAGRVVPPHENASVMLIEEEIFVRTLRVRDYRDDGTEITKSGEGRFYLDSLSTLRRILDTQAPLIIVDTVRDPIWTPDERNWLCSYVGVPIHAEGKIIGFLNLGSQHPGQFTPDHAQRLLAFADQAGVAIQNARLFETVRRQSTELRLRVAERTAELEHERAQLRAILDAITDGVIYHNDQGIPQYTNQALLDLTGYTGSDWLNDANLWMRLAKLPVEETQLRLMDIWERVLRHGIWHGEIMLRRKNGEEFAARLISTKVLGADGNPAGVVTVLRDVSAAKRLEEQKARFITTASHELRTPIANIKTRLYLIEKQPEKAPDHLAVIATVTDHIHKLVDDLLDVSRFQYGVIALHRKNVVLQELIEEVVQVQQPEADPKNLAVTLHLPATPVTIWADPIRLVQVITNLLTNAIRYTDEGGQITIDLTTQIETDAATETHYAILRVHDTGVGIPEAAQAEIFNPFYRVSDYNSGAGLGLSIARAIVELHGGAITVDSARDQGTCFQVKLPLPPKSFPPLFIDLA